MKAYFHVIGCAVAAQSAPAAIDECVGWVRRLGADVLAHNDREAVFVKFDATDGQLIDFGYRSAHSRRPPLLRYGFASGIKESAAGGGQARVGERGIAQAGDLAGAAQPGQVLVSSQLGSLLLVAQVRPYERLRPLQVRLLDGRKASAYAVDPPASPGGAAAA
jgi:hypothetical protein